MFAAYFGEAVALFTALAWALSAQVNGVTALMIGARGIALARLPVSLTCLGILCLALGVEVCLDPAALVFLALSALFGVSICDFSYYMAISRIGPSLATLVQSLSSCLTALLGLFVLRETIGAQGWLGIFIATAGVIITITDGRNIFNVPGRGVISKREFWSGSLFALMAAFSMALSYLFMKYALLSAPVHSVWGSFVRILSGGLFLWIFGFFRGWVRDLGRHATSGAMPWKRIAIGAVFGGTGTWCSLIAVQHTEAGIAATLINLQTVLMIPVCGVAFRKMPGLREVLGIFVAFAGTAVLLLR